jgi:hypothetical protein
LPVASDEVDEEMKLLVAGQLHDELRRLPDVEVRALDGAGTIGGLPSCLPADTPCLIALGEHLGVTWVVAGLVSPDDAGLSLALYAVDASAGTRAHTAQVALGSDRSRWGPLVREGVTRLLAPEQLTGVLVVSVDQPGATILVDGVVQGTSPLEEPIAGLTPGRHALEVRLAGHPAVQRFVTVAFGEVTSERVELGGGEGEPAEPAPEPAAALPWTAIGGGLLGAGALAAAGAGVALFLAVTPSAPVNADPADAVGAAQLWSGVFYGTGALALGLVGGGAAALALGLTNDG